MARSTITEDIARLEVELLRVRDKIAKQEGFKLLEEGSASSRFQTQFTPIETLFDRESKLVARLETLYNYQARL